MAVRIEVKFKEGLVDAGGDLIKKRIAEELGITLDSVRTVDVYSIDKDIGISDLERCRQELFMDPLTQESALDKVLARDFDWIIEIGYLPGVTDNVGRTSKEAIEDLLKLKFGQGEAVYTSRQVLLKGSLTRDEVNRIAGRLSNPLIHRVYIKDFAAFQHDGGIEVVLPRVILPPNPKTDSINLNVSDQELIKLGEAGILDRIEGGIDIRRGPLALELNSLHAIRDYFNSRGREPTDVELESLAQTWSEHCKHNIFAAQLDEVDSLYKTYIQGATQAIRKKLGKRDWCLSVFTDNSGVIKFNEDWNLCYKVETHNTPCALDPYGGAITGIVGVNRDPMGTGKGSRLVVNMYGFCFGNPFFSGELPYRDKELKDSTLHPRVIFEGVRLGVEHGGNKSGIPTPWGFLVFDDRYMGKPLVFVGTVGLMPAKRKGRPSHLKKARPGDLIVMAGGRVGKDGIHGATFSSESLHSGSPAGAVQIGDPITQKKLSDAQQELSELGLFNSVTDNGAGGLSCSVGETARESGGSEVDIEKVPIKYSGLSPYEIWVSESQERMTYAVPPKKLNKFLDLMKRWDVEATVIGEFTDSGRCIVNFQGKAIMDIDLKFLHDGVPRLKLTSTWQPPDYPEPQLKEQPELTDDLHNLLGRLNICSKEYVVRQYDHEVQGGSVIKPLVGVESDVHSDAIVVRPQLSSMKGIALSGGILPGYGDIDPYHMAACCIDTAIRNVVAVGGNLRQIALLDNFCWCSSDEPERLGQLKRAAKACYDYAVQFNTPFISGKDSMFNDFKGFDGKGNPVKISIPPTLLISSLAVIDDVRRCVSLDAKYPGDLIYLLGTTRDELGGSEYYAMKGEEAQGKPYIGSNVPQVNAKQATALYQSISRAGKEELLASCGSISRGGLGVALAKLAMAGELGMEVDLGNVPLKGVERDDQLLFSESQSRLLVTIAPKDKKRFEALMKGKQIAGIGQIIETRRVIFRGIKGKKIVDAEIDSLKEAYKKTLRW
jgi:phosphoribosylformylglycinamidine synthase II